MSIEKSKEGRLYTSKVMEHFLKPHHWGKIDDADGVGRVGNPICGDVMYIYLKIKDDIITDIAFETLGCVAAIATSSMASEMVIGKSLKEAWKLTDRDVANALGGLPASKFHCSMLAEEGLRAAIQDYLKKQGRSIDELK